MNIKNLKKAVADIKRHKDAIAKHRDAIRAITSDLESELDSFDEGVRTLESAIDELSQYV